MEMLTPTPSGQESVNAGRWVDGLVLLSSTANAKTDVACAEIFPPENERVGAVVTFARTDLKSQAICHQNRPIDRILRQIACGLTLASEGIA